MSGYNHSTFFTSVYIDRPVAVPIPRPYPVTSEKLIPGLKELQSTFKIYNFNAFFYSIHNSFHNFTVRIEKKVPYAVPIAGK